ncbi:putative endopeptidase/acetyltransferase [Taylorella equigenitalis 14/56]|uniref:Putative endopeptidase/acetyltransferase n=1 Tax=Taylorella equigenitalis 14/56 TaxID=1091497 RepID=I7IAP7_9BURK|nr:bifunctional tRNA (adenosine(37)-N6)-threonylcarbamoyltransferase complex dimerization subunit type 1 TsaB/ribosomal protein alanine acetyltransferase RimI [Taylorella equigenitalis]ASY30208.1 bifunctional tRNA (adenosine(37)-N6)-threonylcarbamoyltransferase complex dimerization subunit type 1 TsaB/ribosomal protein alanine acetyltransferase RimI [Taylorella equigenitalis]ASY37511.1 bifunctional tRNA (adenosine(37)-N6)-threonylcarbamoyltransferase complex dimerization subunit type 1 TsaB/ribos
MYLISIENAVSPASIALDFKDSVHPVEIKLDANLSQSEAMIPAIDSLLNRYKIDKNQLEGVVFSQGPGAFTGIRVAAGIAQGISLGLNIPLIGVNSLESTAFHFAKEIQGFIFVLNDARMDEVYLGGFFVDSAKRLHEVLEPLLLQKDIALPYIDSLMDGLRLQMKMTSEAHHFNDYTLVGDAAEYFPDVKFLYHKTCAIDLIEFAKASIKNSFTQLGRKNKDNIFEVPLPIYLRKKVAFTSSERKKGYGGNPKSETPEIPQNIMQYSKLAQRFRDAGVVVKPMALEAIDEVHELDVKVHVTPWSRESFYSAFYNDDYKNITLYKDGKLIGVAVQLLYPEESHLMTIGIDSAYRNKGYAKLLMDLMHLYALDQKFKLKNEHYQQILEVRVTNNSAIELYKKYGYEQIGYRKGYYELPDGTKEDGIVYAKRI